MPDNLPLRGIVGVVDVTGIVEASEDPWFDGPFGWTLANPREVPFLPCSGKQRFFEVELPI